MLLDRICPLCGVQLPATKRADAFFCAERHEAAWRKARKLLHTSTLLWEFEQQLITRAPREALWYRLTILIDGAPKTVRVSAKAIRSGLITKPLKRKYGYTAQQKAAAAGH